MLVAKPYPGACLGREQRQGQLREGAGGWRGQHGMSERGEQGSQALGEAAGAGMLCRQPQASPMRSLFSLPQLWSRGPSCFWSCSRPQSPVRSLKMVARSWSGASRAPRVLPSPRGSTRQPGRKGARAALPPPRSPVWGKATGWSSRPQASPVLAARYRTGGTGWGCHCPVHQGLVVPWVKAA